MIDKKLILLPLRVIYFRTFQCEIPCTYKFIYHASFVWRNTVICFILLSLQKQASVPSVILGQQTTSNLQALWSTVGQYKKKFFAIIRVFKVFLSPLQGELDSRINSKIDFLSSLEGHLSHRGPLRFPIHRIWKRNKTRRFTNCQN